MEQFYRNMVEWSTMVRQVAGSNPQGVKHNIWKEYRVKKFKEDDIWYLNGLTHEPGYRHLCLLDFMSSSRKSVTPLFRG